MAISAGNDLEEPAPQKQSDNCDCVHSAESLEGNISDGVYWDQEE